MHPPSVQKLAAILTGRFVMVLPTVLAPLRCQRVVNAHAPGGQVYGLCLIAHDLSLPWYNRYKHSPNVCCDGYDVTSLL